MLHCCWRGRKPQVQNLNPHRRLSPRICSAPAAETNVKVRTAPRRISSLGGDGAGSGLVRAPCYPKSELDSAPLPSPDTALSPLTLDLRHLLPNTRLPTIIYLAQHNTCIVRRSVGPCTPRPALHCITVPSQYSCSAQSFGLCFPVPARSLFSALGHLALALLLLPVLSTATRAAGAVIPAPAPAAMTSGRPG